MVKIVVLLIIIYLLNLVDYWQTTLAISLCGIGVELNPIARFLIENDYGWVVKIIVFAALLVVMGFLVHKIPSQIYMIYVLAIVFCIVVIHNFIMLTRMGAL